MNLKSSSAKSKTTNSLPSSTATSEIPTLLDHQKKSVAILKKNARVFDTSDPGCVSADTEFLTAWGWKRIDQYSKGDLVAQFHPETKEISWVEPLQYIKIPCNEMVWINPVRGTSQRLSPEHRVLLYKPNNTFVVRSAYEYMQLLHQKTASHYRERFCSTFKVKDRCGLIASDKAIRLMIAVIADGHFSHNTTRCVVRLKKERKIERLRELLAGTTYNEKTCGGQPDFQVFTFNAPWNEKSFGSGWWSATQQQLEVIADELPHWDGSISVRPSKGVRFSSLSEESANFAQYAFAAAGYNTSKSEQTHNGRHIEYVVHVEQTKRYVGGGRKESVFLGPNDEGFKYCFEVPSSFLLLRHNGYIFATGNTGKTAVHITDFAARRRKGGGCALVLCPKSLIYSAWGRDFKTFAPDMKVSLAYADNRSEAFSVDADVYVTNIDAATWLLEQKPKFWSKFEVLIIDESTSVKHHTSKRSKAVAKFRKYFEVRRLLTGTPTSNGICDIHHQMYIVDDGKKLGESFYAFRSAVCVPIQIGKNKNAIQWKDKPGVESLVAALIKDSVIRHKFEDCVDIPPNHRFTVNFALGKHHRKEYDKLERDSFLLAKKDKKSVTAVNGAVLYGKLLQCASGAVYTDDDEYTLLDVDRYDLIADLVEARNHSIVFFNWKHQRDELIKVFEQRKWAYALIDGTVTAKGAREKIVEDYQAGKYKVLLAHPKSAGHGLTLTKGTTTIFASPTPDLEFFLQAYKRIYRIGQTEKTETIMVIAENTIDEYVWKQCQVKDIRQFDLLEYFG